MLIEHGAPRVYRHILHRGYRGATTWGSMDSWEAHLCKLFLCASFLVDVWMILFGLWRAHKQGDGELSEGRCHRHGRGPVDKREFQKPTKVCLTIPVECWDEPTFTLG